MKAVSIFISFRDLKRKSEVRRKLETIRTLTLQRKQNKTRNHNNAEDMNVLDAITWSPEIDTRCIKYKDFLLFGWFWFVEKSELSLWEELKIEIRT